MTLKKIIPLNINLDLLEKQLQYLSTLPYCEEREGILHTLEYIKDSLLD
jgi:hypothetical protein